MEFKARLLSVSAPYASAWLSLIRAGFTSGTTQQNWGFKSDGCIGMNPSETVPSV